MTGQVIRVIHDVDFAVMAGHEMSENGDDAILKLEEKHGTVIYVTGLVEDDPDAIIVFGAEDGETNFRVAFYKPYAQELSVMEK